MNRFKTVILSIVCLSSCGGSDDDSATCPEVTLPVIIPAVNVKLFDASQDPLDVCDAILTIESSNNSETIYGSAFNNCSERLV